MQYSAAGCSGGDSKFIEMYSYSPAGARLKKRLRVSRTLSTGGQPYTGTGDLDSSYTYDNEGRMTQMKYPDSGTSGTPVTGPAYNYSYDTFGRRSAMTDQNNTSVAAATYGPLGELLTLDGQTYTYNSLLQLTRVQGASMDIQYRYSATQNNGKILSQYDAISGEEVTYTYDSLQRLSGAVTTTNPSVSQWGQAYTYDGWGNLTNISVTKGSAPTLSVVADPATNRSSAYSYDANGNAGGGSSGAYTFDIENRLTTVVATGLTYGYAADNKRVYKRTMSGSTVTDEEIYFYSVTGQKLGRYGLSVSGPSGQPLAVTVTFTQRETKAWFGGKLVGAKADRLGSIGKYYPYGDDKGSGNPANGTEKFATYTRDAETGLDYADQRYHAPGTGRFMTADPYQASGGPGDPGSWNRYGYVGGDPANWVDPTRSCDNHDQHAGTKSR